MNSYFVRALAVFALLGVFSLGGFILAGHADALNQVGAAIVGAAKSLGGKGQIPPPPTGAWYTQTPQAANFGSENFTATEIFYGTKATGTVTFVGTTTGGYATSYQLIFSNYHNASDFAVFIPDTHPGSSISCTKESDATYVCPPLPVSSAGPNNLNFSITFPNGGGGGGPLPSPAIPWAPALGSQYIYNGTTKLISDYGDLSLGSATVSGVTFSTISYGTNVLERITPALNVASPPADVNTGYFSTPYPSIAGSDGFLSGNTFYLLGAGYLTALANHYTWGIDGPLYMLPYQFPNAARVFAVGDSVSDGFTTFSMYDAQGNNFGFTGFDGLGVWSYGDFTLFNVNAGCYQSSQIPSLNGTNRSLCLDYNGTLTATSGSTQTLVDTGVWYLPPYEDYSYTKYQVYTPAAEQGNGGYYSKKSGSGYSLYSITVSTSTPSVATSSIMSVPGQFVYPEVIKTSAENGVNKPKVTYAFGAFAIDTSGAVWADGIASQTYKDVREYGISDTFSGTINTTNTPFKIGTNVGTALTFNASDDDNGVNGIVPFSWLLSSDGKIYLPSGNYQFSSDDYGAEFLANVDYTKPFVYATTISIPGQEAPTPGCILSASPASIGAGSSSTLTWSSTNTTSMTINDGIGPVTPVSGGSVSTGNLATTTTFMATAADSSGNDGYCSATVTVGPDTQPPSVPKGLVGTSTSSTVIALSWLASTDNVGVVGYHIFRNGNEKAIATTTSYIDTGLTPLKTYTYVLDAYDAAGNRSAQSAPISVATLGGPDTQPPTVPANLKAGKATNTTIPLSWNASKDNVGVTGYDIFRNGTKAGTTTSTSYTDTGLTASTTYQYAVDAYNAAGNHSAHSSSISVTTTNTKDTQPPTVPTTLKAGTPTNTTIPLSWKASTDNEGVTGYDIYRNGVQVGIATSTSYIDTGLSTDTKYTYTVDAYDAAGNHSAQSASVSATTSGPDSQPPTVPTNLKAGKATNSAVPLSWKASTDNTGVTGYDIYRNGTQVATATSTSYTDTGLSPGTTYTYTVDAYDAAGNHSAQSASVSATTSSDTEPPSVPTGLGGSPNKTDVVLYWNASTGNPKGYDIYRNSVMVDNYTDINNIFYIDTGLSEGTTYTYTVDAYDAAGNHSAQSAPIQVTTKGTPGSDGNGGSTAGANAAGSTGSTANTTVSGGTSGTNSSGASATSGTATPALDTTSPSAPTLSASTSGQNVSLSWSGATDDVGVKSYRVLRDSAVIAIVSDTAYTDADPSPGFHAYVVKAVDAAGNISGPSNKVTVTIPGQSAARAVSSFMASAWEGFVSALLGK